MWKVLGILVGVMVAISCFAFCVAVAHSNSNSTTITNNRQSGKNIEKLIQFSIFKSFGFRASSANVSGGSYEYWGQFQRFH